MGTMAVQSMTAAQAIYTVPDPAGDDFPNDGQVFLWVYNDSGGDISITFSATRRCNHGFLDDMVLTGHEDSITIVGAFSRYRFNDPNGNAHFVLSATNNVGIAAVRAPPARIPY
jgi:hypothetical protein